MLFSDAADARDLEDVQDPHARGARVDAFDRRRPCAPSRIVRACAPPPAAQPLRERRVARSSPRRAPGRRRHRSARGSPSRRRRRRSRVPPASVATTGTPAASASIATTGVPSFADARRKASNAAYQGRRRGGTRAIAAIGDARATRRELDGRTVLAVTDQHERRVDAWSSASDAHEVERALDRGQPADPPDDEVSSVRRRSRRGRLALPVSSRSRVEVEAVADDVELLGWGDVVADEVVPYLVADRDQAIRRWRQSRARPDGRSAGGACRSSR